MKKITLLLLTVLASSMVTAQTTFDISWLQGTEEATVTIEIGDTVTWIWDNGAPHNVTSDDPDAPEDLGSDTVTMEGFEYSFTFTNMAEIDYLCSVHPGSMFGTITVSEPLSVADKFATNVSFYPNPVRDVLTINSLFKLDAYTIYSLDGKKVAQGAATGNISEVSMADLAKGLYMVTVNSGSMSTTLQVVKQ